MKGDKWNQTMKNRAWMALGMCLLTAAIAVCALLVYNSSLRRYFADPSDEIARAESEMSTEERIEESIKETERQNEAETSGQTEDSGDVTEMSEEAKAEEAEEVAKTPVDSETVAEAGALPSADTGEEMLVESQAEGDVQAAENEVQASTLQFFADSTMLWPVEGDVILDYSPDSTIYFPTLEQYRVNRGILIQAAVGTEVIAPADAVVEEIGYDDEIGTYIRLNLGGGYEVTCGQLKDVCVIQEQIVKAGEVIASLNTPTRYFTVEGSHLFVRVEKEGDSVDPLDYIR